MESARRTEGLDRRLISDAALLPLAGKIERGQRLTPDDGVLLFRSPDLLGVGHLADAVNRAKHGHRVTFAANQHINPTNICTLRKTCVFCSYARLPKEAGAYRYTLEQTLAEAATANSTLTREFHIVGGLDMKAGLAYYSEMFVALKERFPHVHIKALTAVEIAHIARIEKLSYREVLIRLRAAGLDTMPGGGAEVFSKGVRATIADRKLAAEEWIEVHRVAHALGIRSNCTMLYGHVETVEDRIEHLTMLRALQDETGGFLAYIPLAYHPDHNELGHTLGREGTATSGFDDLRNLAVGRLYLDNFDHVKTHWVMVTPFISQTSLHFGVNDLEGTMVHEKIYHEAGAHTAQAMSLEQILRLIRNAGKIPVERDSLYQTVRTFEDFAGSDGLSPKARVMLSAGEAGLIVRVGRIPYINCYPVYGAVDRGVVSLNAEIVDGVPTALNRLMAAGALDVSVVSAVEYAREARQYLLLPDLAISCDGPVRSVMLFAKRPASELHGRRVLVSRSSMTSVALLELLFEHVWDAKPAFVPSDAEVSDVARFGDAEEHDARLVIGDAALVLGARLRLRQAGDDSAGSGLGYRYAYDLGAEWKQWTGLPFVFAVWVARRDVPVDQSLALHAGLIASRDWGLGHLDLLAAQAALATGVRKPVCLEYLSGLDYGLSYGYLAGLTEFFRRLVAAGRVPNGSLAFLPAA